MSQLNRIDRVRGCLLGLAVGDALGAPLEGLSAQQIRAHYGQVDDYVDGSRAWKRKPYRWRMPGLYSDDTQQALALTDVLLGCGRVDPDRLADVYVRLANPKGSYVGAHRGPGRSFRLVLAALEGGVSPRLSGQTSAGIGAAMRIAPVALYHDPDQTDAMFEAVMAASLMTHRDVRSLSGALAVVHALRRLLAGESREPSLLFRVAADVARDEARVARTVPGVTSVEAHGRSLSQAVAHVESLLDCLPREQALLALVEEANRHGADPVCKRPTMGFPPACIPTCLYTFMATDSFEEAAVEVVNMGGDADSAGAILGALAGAYYGVDAIPGRWLARLQNRDAIELRAGALDARWAEGLDIPDLVEREQELSDRENACREHLLAHPQNGGDLGANRRL
jgi:ADP-ribosylglycohydrolase